MTPSRPTSGAGTDTGSGASQSTDAPQGAIADAMAAVAPAAETDQDPDAMAAVAPAAETDQGPDPTVSQDLEPGPSAGIRPQRGLIDVLRFFGLARRPVPRPVIGKKAYVRWWERLRAAFLLVAIVIVLGFVVAAIIGIAVLAAGFLLEQAIS